MLFSLFFIGPLILFISLTIWVTMLIFLVQSKERNSFKQMVALLRVINVLFFQAENLLSLYILFEISLIPTVLIIFR